MGEEQWALLVAGIEYTDEPEDLCKCNNMPIEISKEYANLARKQGLDDPLDEQTACGLMLQVFIHHHM